jgi:hypothetical protein
MDSLITWITILQCRRRLFDVSYKGVYGADPLNDLKCNQLVVLVFGRSCHPTFLLLHCFTLLMNSNWVVQCLVADCHPLQGKGYQIIA